MTIALVCKSIDPQPIFDDSKLCITGWFSAPTVDAHNEIIDASVIDLSQHASNPVHLYNHKQSELPVAMHEDPDGNYSLGVRPFPGGGNGLYGEVYYSQKANPMGRQIYELFKEKILRQYSVGFINGPIVREKSHGGRTVSRITSGVLKEISSVPLGANPDAVATIVHKGFLSGERIAEPLMLSLKAFLPIQKTFVATLPVLRCLKNSVCITPATSLRLKTLKIHSSDENTAMATEAELKTKSDGEGCKADAHALVDELFAKGEDGATILKKLKALKKAHGALTATGEGDDDMANAAMEKSLGEVIERLNVLTERDEVTALKLSEIDTLKVKCAELETAHTEFVNKTYDRDTTALSGGINKLGDLFVKAGLAGAA